MSDTKVTGGHYSPYVNNPYRDQGWLPVYGEDGELLGYAHKPDDMTWEEFIAEGEETGEWPVDDWIDASELDDTDSDTEDDIFSNPDDDETDDFSEDEPFPLDGEGEDDGEGLGEDEEGDWDLENTILGGDGEDEEGEDGGGSGDGDEGDGPGLGDDGDGDGWEDIPGGDEPGIDGWGEEGEGEGDSGIGLEAAENAEDAREREEKAREASEEVNNANTDLGDLDPDAIPDETDLGSGSEVGGNSSDINGTSEGGEPVNMFTGVFSKKEEDVRIPSIGGDFVIYRTYKSNFNVDMSLGKKWLLNLEENLTILNNGNVLYMNESGDGAYFEKDGDNYKTPTGHFTELVKLTDSSYLIIDGIGTTRSFNGEGKLVSIIDRFENSISISHDTSGKITEVTDTSGRVYSFTYTSDRLSKITDYIGREIKYSYTNGSLSRVEQFAPSASEDGPIYRYTYEDGIASDIRTHGNMIEIKDESHQRILFNEYSYSGDDSNRVISQDYEGGEINFTYTVDDYICSKTVVDDRLNNRVIHYFNDENQLTKIRKYVTDQDTSSTISADTLYEYNSQRLISKITSPDGRYIRYTYDLSNGDVKKKSNISRISYYPTSGSTSRIKEFTYGVYNQVESITDEEGHTQTFDLSSLGLVSEAIDPGISVNGVPNQSAVTEFNYNNKGQLTSRENPNGLRSEFSYFTTSNQNGLLKKVTIDPTGENFSHEWELDDIGNITLDTNPYGGEIEYVRDLRGRVTAIKINDIVIKEITHDQYDRITMVRQLYLKDNTSTADGRWLTKVNEYDDYGRLFSVELKEGSTVLEKLSNTYDEEGNIVSVTGPSTYTTKFEYDERRNVVRETLGFGSSNPLVNTFKYNISGNLQEAIYHGNRTFTYTYDTYGIVNSITDPLGNRLEYEYDKTGQVEKVEGYASDGKRLLLQNIEYDAAGNPSLTKVANLNNSGNPVGWREIKSEYDLEYNEIKTTLPNGIELLKEFDIFGNATKETNQSGSFVENQYTFGSLLESVTQNIDHDGAFGVTKISYQYDEFGRLTHALNSAGRETSVSFDNFGNIIKKEHSNGLNIDFEFDLLGRMINQSIKDTSSSTIYETAVSYNDLGLPENYTDEEGNVYTLSYDSIGRIKSVDIPGKRLKEFEYDSAGNINREINSNGVNIIQAFDDLGRLTRKDITGVSSGVTFESFQYYGVDRLLSATNDFGSTTFEYDSTGNPKKITFPNGKVIEHSYNSDGSISSTDYSCGLELNYNYNTEKRIGNLSASLPGSNSYPGQSLAGEVASYEYFGSGLPSEISYINGTKLESKIDIAGREFFKSIKKNSDVIYEQIKLSDSSGLPRIIKDNIHETLQNEFNQRGELTRTQAGLISSSLDDLGGEFEIQGVTPPSKLFSDIEAITLNSTSAEFNAYTYDTRGNLLNYQSDTENLDYSVEDDNRLLDINGTPLNYDDSGNLVGDGSYLFEYDYYGRPVVIKDSSGQTLFEAKHDPFGRIIELSVGGTSQKIIYDGNYPVEYFDASGNSQRVNLVDPNTGQIFLVGANTQNYVVGHDLFNNISIVTDSNGDLVESYAYDPFGKRRIYDSSGTLVSSSSLPIKEGMSGLIHIDNSPIILSKNRALHTDLRRFITPDQSGFVDGTNLYWYGRNNPFVFEDTEGDSATVLGGLVGAGAGFIYGTGTAAWNGQGLGGSLLQGLDTGFRGGVSGALIGAGVDLAPVGFGSVSSVLMGAGISGAISATDTSKTYGEWLTDMKDGAIMGLAFWALSKIIPGIGVGLGITPAITGSFAFKFSMGLAKSAGAKVAGSGAGKLAIQGARSVVNSMGRAAEGLPGNAVVSRIVGNSMRNDLGQFMSQSGARGATNALSTRSGASAISQADAAGLAEIHAQTMARMGQKGAPWLNTKAPWDSFRGHYWREARHTPAYQAMFPNQVSGMGSTAPVMGTNGRLHIHHLQGRIRGIEFQGSNLSLVPQKIDWRVHSWDYLTGSRDWAMRRGFRSLFPRQWEKGVAAGAVQMLRDFAEDAYGAGGAETAC